MNERIMELVHGELDGTNTAAESAELTSLLETDDIAKTYFEETSQLFSTLGSVSEADPPPELKARIMKSISEATAAEVSTSPGFMESLRNFFSPILQRPALAVSYAFVVGLLIGAAALLMVGETTPPPAQAIQGTIGQSPTTVIDEARVSVADIVVHLTTSQMGRAARLDVNISGSGEAVVEIGYAGSTATIVTTTGPKEFSLEIDAEKTVDVRVTSSDEQATASLTVMTADPVRTTE